MHPACSSVPDPDSPDTRDSRLQSTGKTPQDQSHSERHASGVCGCRRAQSLAQEAFGLAAILPAKTSLFPTPDALRAGVTGLGCSGPDASSARPVRALFAHLGAGSKTAIVRTELGRIEKFPPPARTTLVSGCRFCPPLAPHA